VVRDTQLHQDREQARDLKPPASAGLITVLMGTCLSSVSSHIFSLSDKSRLLHSPNVKHSLSALARLLLFPGFHLLADLSSYSVVADFALLNNGTVFTLSVSSAVQPLSALK